LNFGIDSDNPAETAPAKPILPPDPLRNSRNFRLDDDVASHIAEGGPKARIQHNLDILELFKTIQGEQRTAAPDEQNRIAQYIDFGGLRELWDQGYRYYEERNRLAEILTEEEIDAVKETSLNTHYTAIEIVDQMWEAAGRLGFAGGRILEPGMGVGNFFARIPDQFLHESELFGVEKNPLSGALASLLYPDAKILVQPFEDTRLPNNSFDLVIGNPPFADIKIADPEYSDPKLSLHNYFLVKSLDKLKPGGIAVCISSHYTLDSLDVRPRRALAARADLIAAIRLPEDAFQKNANTSVTTDILFFRKRLPNEPQPEHPVWIDSLSHVIPGYSDSSAVNYNAYFDEHPEMVLGVHSAESRMYGRKDYTLKPFEGDTSIVERLQKAIETLPENVVTPYDPSLSQGSRTNRSASSLVPAPNTIKNHSYFLDEGTVWFNDNGARTPLPRTLSSGRILFQLKSLIALRDTLKEVIRLQLQPSDEGQLAECQEQLLQHYESYRANFGPLNNISTAKLFEDDPEYPLLTALENVDPETSRISLADIFTKRTIRPYEPLRELPSDPKAAMLQVLAECGRLDTGLMSRLLDKPESEVIAQLVAADLIYKEPHSQQYQTADEYLSGNVRQKLKDAQGAILLDSAYERNVKALQAVQPEIVPFIDIDVRLGQTWVPTEVYIQFLNRHMAEQRPATGDRAPSITRDLNGRWSVDLPSCYNAFELTHKWAGGGMSGHKLLEYGLNLQEPTIYQSNADGKPVIDTVRTIAARARLREIKDAFSEWVKDDKQADIHPQIERIYNETFNATRLRVYDGGHLSFPGLNPTVVPRPYQMRGAWRVMVEGRALLDHFVGSGKSLSVIIAGMESRRIGISRKNLYVVPNNMIQQWREEFKKAYPSANVLAVTERDFDSPLSRKRLFSRVATNEWDAVIVPHSQFDMLPISPEREAKTVNAQMQEMKDLLREGAETNRPKTRAEKRTTRQIENKIQKYKEKLKELSQGRKDDTIYFDDLGIDRLFVDEAHAYKALAIVTKMGNIAGISTRESQRAQRILAKIEFMQETHNGAGVIFTTATPITNTLGEQFVMTRYLARDILTKCNIHNFDDWAANFAEPVTRMEYATDGITIRPKTALANYVNVPELQSIWSQFADVMMQDEAEEAGYITLPNAVRKDLLVKVTPAQEPLLQSIAERGELLSLPMSDPDRPDPTEDNWLKLDSDACAISLDARLYDPTCPDDPDSKANTAVRKALDVLHRTEAERGTIIVFADRYQRGDFNLFEDIKAKLIAAGVPREQVAIVHDYKKGKEFFGLQQAMRAGRVRVLLGTTEKCGIGVNIQTRLKALIDLDLPQRPDQLEQRHGRIRRSGNTFSEVEFYRMISEPRDVASPKAHDLQRAQLLERKQTFLSQFKSGGRMGRKIEDIAGETRLSPQMFALAKAQATGNPLALEKIKLEYEIKNLTLLARSNRLDHYNNRQQLLNVEYRIAHLKDRLPQLQEANRVFKSHERRDDEGKLLSLQVRFNGLEFSRLKDANEYLRTVSLDSTTQLTVNGLDIPLAVSDALIKDELGTITDITAVRYSLAGEWFDVPRPEAHMGMPSAQSLLTSVLRRGGDLPTKILETESSILENESTLARLHTALDYQNPYEAKLNEYEQRIAEVDKELLGKTEEVEELVDAETEELPSAKTLPVERESTDSEDRVCAEAIEDRFPAQVAVDDAPSESLEVPAIQAPRFKRRQTADRGR
jgi:N12 class adenine-specific DNA methylase